MPQLRRGLVLMSLQHVCIRCQLQETPHPTLPAPQDPAAPPTPPRGPRQHSQRSEGAYLLWFLAEQEALVKPELREDTADKGNGTGIGGTVVQPPGAPAAGPPQPCSPRRHRSTACGQPVGFSPSRGDRLQSTARDLPCTPAPTPAVLHRKLGWGPARGAGGAPRGWV